MGCRKEKQGMIYIELFWAFFKIGLFTFGGGYAMLPLIQSEVAAHGWMSMRELVNFVAVSESTPGPFAVNVSTYVGTVVGGVPGGICATLGVITPSFVIILIVARCFEAFKQNQVVKGCMSGLKPAVIGLIGAAVISVGKTVFVPDGSLADMVFMPEFYVSLVIFVVVVVMAFKKVHPILLICLSMAVGIAAGYVLELPY